MNWKSRKAAVAERRQRRLKRRNGQGKTDTGTGRPGKAARPSAIEVSRPNVPRWLMPLFMK